MANSSLHLIRVGMFLYFEDFAYYADHTAASLCGWAERSHPNG